MYTGPRLNIKTVFPGIGIPMSKIKQPYLQQGQDDIFISRRPPGFPITIISMKTKPQKQYMIDVRPIFVVWSSPVFLYWSKLYKIIIITYIGSWQGFYNWKQAFFICDVSMISVTLPHVLAFHVDRDFFDDRISCHSPQLGTERAGCRHHSVASGWVPELEPTAAGSDPSPRTVQRKGRATLD